MMEYWTMRRRLPMRFPIGSKYVLEARGLFVIRSVEFPDGQKIKLSKRKAPSYGCREHQQIGIVPDQQSEPIEISPSRKVEPASS